MNMDNEKIKKLSQAMQASIEEYKRENPYWFASSLLRIIRQTLASLRHYIENPEDAEVTWQQAKAELQFPIRWDFTNRCIIYFDSVIQDLRLTQQVLTEALMSSITISCLEGLHQAAYEKNGDTYHHFLQQAQEELYQSLPTDKQERFLKSCLAPYFIGPQIWDTSQLAQTTIEHQSDPLEKRLLILKKLFQSTKEEEDLASFHYNQNGKDLTLGLQIAIHPLVIDVSKQQAFFPIHVRLINSSTDTPSTWSEVEREQLWGFLLHELEEREAKWLVEFKTSLEIGALLSPLRISPQASSITPIPERGSSKFDPVPMPRSATKEAENVSLLRGLGRMFSGEGKVPDLDLRGDIAQGEAERLFWLLLNHQITQYLTTQQFSSVSWTQIEQAGKTIFQFRGLQEQELKTLWNQVTKAANAGDGGPGLEIADPAFENKNRLENNQSVVETHLILWPEESLQNKEGYPVSRVHFRRSSSPGYQALLQKYMNEHKGKSFFADGWLWIPKGGVKEGFRIGGLPTLLLPQGRAALESLQRKLIQNYEDELHRIFTAQNLSLTDQQLTLFKGDETKVIRDLQQAIVRVKQWLSRLSVYDIGTDLILCIFEAFHHQRNAWYAEKLLLPEGKEVITKPWRIIALYPEDLHKRLDPHKKWGQNWRNRLFEKLEALSTFERQTRTLDDKKMDVGDRFIRRVIDGWAGIEDGHAPEWDSGLGLTRLLKQANVFPINAFFIEVSAEFMARLITWAVDQKGVIHWGLEAAKATHRAALAAPNPNYKEALNKKREIVAQVKKQPYYQHSPRLLTFSNLKEWPTDRKILAYVLLQEANSRLSDGTFTPCNGKLGHGYKVKIWMEKAGYLQPQRVRRKSHRHLYKTFLEDLRELQQSLELRLQLKQEPSLDSDGVLKKLDSLVEEVTVAHLLLLKIYLPSNYEEQLAVKLQKAGIEEAVEQIQKSTETIPSGEITSLDLITARKKAKLTQKELAQKMGVSQPMINYWEKGKKPIPQDQLSELKQVLSPFL